MTAPTITGEEWREFRAALSNRAAASFSMAADELAQKLGPLIRKGWTVKELAQHCSKDVDQVDNPGALVRHRLDAAADLTPPARVNGMKKFTQPKPYCGRCDDPITRWLLDDYGNIISRCPHCWTAPA